MCFSANYANSANSKNVSLLCIIHKINALAKKEKVDEKILEYPCIDCK